MLQKSRMLQLQEEHLDKINLEASSRKAGASKGEVVVGYRNPLATQKMPYHRLSRRVNNRTAFLLVMDATFNEFDKIGLI